MMGTIFFLFAATGIVFGDVEHKSVTSYGRSTRPLAHEAIIIPTEVLFMWHECFYDRAHIAREKAGKTLEKREKVVLHFGYFPGHQIRKLLQLK